MAKKALFGSIALTCLMVAGVYADSPPESPPSCGTSQRPMRITARHIEGKGIGYNQGYTTLEGFFSLLQPWKNAWIPFLDLRAHVFNNAKMAANAGMGIRYLTGSRIWGGNTYYDYRNTHRQHYNQVSMGLESLGRIWDFLASGYLPVGAKTSPSFHTRFKGFKNHYMLLSRKREFAMKGANAEVGAHVDHFKHVPLYFAAGPYYLEGQGKATWGGELRAAIDIYDYVRLEGNTSYDSAFNWIGQGQISVNIPLGKKRKVKQGKSSSCLMAMALSDRALQRVDRNEIIPVDRQHRETKAINPATGKPYVFWFVNNTSHSAGSFESPFPTLMAAQNASGPGDVIYVFSGDGTSTGMDSGIALQNSQKLFGAGIGQTLETTVGTINIPAQSTGMPLITATLTSVIAAANNNEISGIHIVSSNVYGVDCSGITNTWIHNNVIETFNAIFRPTGISTFFDSCAGQISVLSNEFILSTGSSRHIFGVHILSSAPGANYLFDGNSFTGITTNVIGFEFGSNDNPIGNFGSITITNNPFTLSARPIGGFGFSGIGQINISKNIFNKCRGNTGTNNFGSVSIGLNAGANILANMTDNTWTNSPILTTPSIGITTKAANAKVCVNLMNNTSDATDSAYTLDNTLLGTFKASVSGNIGTVTEIAVTPGTCP